MLDQLHPTIGGVYAIDTGFIQMLTASLSCLWNTDMEQKLHICFDTHWEKQLYLHGFNAAQNHNSSQPRTLSTTIEQMNAWLKENQPHILHMRTQVRHVYEPVLGCSLENIEIYVFEHHQEYAFIRIDPCSQLPYQEKSSTSWIYPVS